MADPWTRVAQTTIERHTREVEDLTMLRTPILARLRSLGHIEYNVSGKSWTRRVKYNNAPMVSYADADTLTFPRRNRHKFYELDLPRGYTAAESYTEVESLQNRGTEAIVKAIADLGEDMADDLERNFRSEIFVDGYAANNLKKLIGFESALGASSTTSDSGKVRLPDDDYGGHPTDVGQEGTWTSGSWPSGYGDGSYDWNSPILVNTSHSTAWGSGAGSFATSGLAQLRYAIRQAKERPGRKGKVDMGLMSGSMWDSFVSLIEVKERIVTQRGQGNSAMIKLGFDAINYDGVDFIHDESVPADTIYIFNSSMIQLMSMYSTLFKSKGPWWYPPTLSYLMMNLFLGQMFFVPRGFVKMYPYG